MFFCVSIYLDDRSLIVAGAGNWKHEFISVRSDTAELSDHDGENNIPAVKSQVETEEYGEKNKHDQKQYIWCNKKIRQNGLLR